MKQKNTQKLVSNNLHVEISQPKISGNLVDLFPCLQPPEVREQLERQSQLLLAEIVELEDSTKSDRAKSWMKA